jgi:hypothetical protein
VERDSSLIKYDAVYVVIQVPMCGGLANVFLEWYKKESLTTLKMDTESFDTYIPIYTIS